MNIPVPRYIREYAAAIRRTKQTEYEELHKSEIRLDIGQIEVILDHTEKGLITYTEAIKELLAIDTRQY
jgi:hypothetical protein